MRFGTRTFAVLAACLVVSHAVLDITQSSSGLVAARSLKNPQTQDQLKADPFWDINGSAVFYDAPYKIYQTTTGMHMGSQSPGDPSWVGIFATTRSSGDVAGVTLEAPVRKVSAGNHVTGIYTQTSIDGRITYVMCGAVTSTSNTQWEIDQMYEDPTTGQRTRTILWTDTTPNQPLKRTCALVTNGVNFLKVYLDGVNVYENHALNLGMTTPYYVFIETQTSNTETEYEGTFTNFYEANHETVVVSNLPSGSASVTVDYTGGTLTFPVTAGSSSVTLTLGQIPFPFTGTIKVRDASNAVLAQASGLSISGGDTYAVAGGSTGGGGGGPCATTSAQIVIDGAFTDWSAVAAASTAPQQNIPSMDFQSFSVAVDANYVYFRISLYTNARPFSDSNTHLFFDLDGNTATGYKPTSTSGMGSEFMIEAGKGYTQSSASWNTGTIAGVNWAIAPSVAAKNFELRLARTLSVGGAPLFPTSGCINVMVQDNRNTQRTLTASFTLGDQCPSHAASISVDGSFSDWSSVPTAWTGPSVGVPMDITTIYAAHDANYLYLRIKLASAAKPFSTYDTHVLADTDGNADTGYDIVGIGSEFMIESFNGYDQRTGVWNAGTVTDGASSNAPMVMLPSTATAGTDYEMRISRNAMYTKDNTAVFQAGKCMSLAVQDNRDGVARVFNYRLS